MRHQQQSSGAQAREEGKGSTHHGQDRGKRTVVKNSCTRNLLTDGAPQECCRQAADCTCLTQKNLLGLRAAMDQPGSSTKHERLLLRILLALGAILVVCSISFTGLLVFSWGPAASRRIARSHVSSPPELTPIPLLAGSPEAAARSTPFATLGIVWVDTRSHIYHFPGSFWYGTTIQGKYASEQDALAEGNRAALNERRSAGFGLTAQP